MLKGLRRLLVWDPLAFLGCGVLGMVLLVSWGLTRFAWQQAESRVTAELAHASREIDSRFGDIERLAESIGTLWEKGALNPKDADDTWRVLEPLARVQPHLTGVNLMCADGRGFGLGRVEDRWGGRAVFPEGNSWRFGPVFGARSPVQGTDPVALDYRERPWYQLGLRVDNATWTDVILMTGRRAGKPGIFLVRPARSASGSLLGVLSLDLMLDSFTQVVDEVRPTPGAWLLVMDDRGRVVVPPAVPGQPRDETLNLQPVGPDRFPLAYDLFRRAKEGASPEAMYGSQRDHQHGRIRALGRKAGPLWYLVLALPDRDITTDPWRRAMLVAFLSAGLLSLFAALAFHLAHRVARPLAELVTGAEALARGQDPVLPPPNIQEIQTLGQALTTARRGMVEREALQRTLLTGQRLEALGTLAGGIAHDLNNQLLAILAQLELGLNKVPKDHPSWKNLRLAWDASQRCTDTCKALLAFGRPVRPNLAPMDFDKLVSDTLGFVVDLLGENIRVVRDLRATPALVMADRAQVEHLVTNLMINARDALPAGGTIRVSTAVVGEGLELRVQDNGIGMTPEVLERIFDPFYTTKEPGRGTGMGLTMAMSVAKAHGGRIEAKSKPGEGSTLILRLPLATSQTSEPESAAAQPSPRLQGLSILVADDEEGVAAALAEALEANGVLVSFASDGEAAWALLEARPHDLLLTDNLMPRCTGRELVERLRAKGSRIPVVLMSGWDLESQEGPLASDPNLMLLAKPFTISRMIAALDDLLRRSDRTSAEGFP